MLKDGDPAEIMERLLKEREPLYAQADLTVNSEDGPHQMAVDQIVAMLKDRALLEAA
jgi:shikimate kinase